MKPIATTKIEALLKNGGKEQVLNENRPKLSPGDLNTSKPPPSRAQVNQQRLDALRGKINNQNQRT